MSEPKRLGKQFLYSVFYLALFSGIGYGIYLFSLKPPASCIDGKLNQNEEQIDCGGPNCAPCELRTLKPIEVASVLVFRSEGMALITLKNPNPTYGAAKLSYEVRIMMDASSSQDFESETFIYPGQSEKFIVWTNDAIKDSADFKVRVGEHEWVPVSAFPRPNMSFRGVQNFTESGKIIINGVLQNGETLLFPRITIGAVFMDSSGRAIGLSQTEVRDVKAFEERFFQIEHPFSSAMDQNRTKIFFEAKRP